MKKNLFLALPAFFATFALLLLSGCNGNNSSKEGSLVGSWYSEEEGEYEDIIKTDFVFYENGKAKITWMSTYDNETETIDCTWKLDGNELVLTSPDWDDEDLRYEYEVTDDKLILDPNANCYAEFTRK